MQKIFDKSDEKFQKRKIISKAQIKRKCAKNDSKNTKVQKYVKGKIQKQSFKAKAQNGIECEKLYQR